MLMLEENPHTSSRQTVSALNISHSLILHVLTENQMHPYKVVPTNELAEDDFDRRILFYQKNNTQYYVRLHNMEGILDDEQKLDILLDTQDNPHKPTRQVAVDND
ncbi:hypothetical protein NQ318_010963, partial [Aromia moschata]